MEYITMIEIAGTLLGFLYLYYELRASRWMFPVGILMSALYVGIFFVGKFYAFALINIYFTLMQAYAWWRWDTAGKEQPLQHAPASIWTPLISITVIIFLILWKILSLLPNQSEVAWGDSLITTLSVVALWMLSHKFVEQWILLIVANAFSVGLFFHQHLYPTAFLYLIYLIASFVGYNAWKKKIPTT